MSSLCLSCCSTLSSKFKPQHTTKCCNRHICGACLATNPRLTQYHPCLFCVGGVQVASGSKALPPEYTSPRIEQIKQEENTFVIGDDEGDEDEDVTKRPMNEDATREVMVGSEQSLGSYGAPEQASLPAGPVMNPKYWIQKRDTLKGIALRLGVNGCHNFTPLYWSQANYSRRPGRCASLTHCLSAQLQQHRTCSTLEVSFSSLRVLTHRSPLTRRLNKERNPGEQSVR